MQDQDRRAQEPEYEGLDFSQYKDWWREAVDGYAEPRRQHIRDEEYYDGDVRGTGWGHWTESQLSTLMGRKQPPTTRNIICRKVNAICGVEQRARSEPRALPRTPKDQQSAEIATDALRYVKEQSRWENTKAERFLEAVKIGYAAVEIGGAEDHVPVTPIPWREFFFDPRSRAFDFSDARYLGVAKWLDKDVAVATYAGPEIAPPSLPPQPLLPPQPMEPQLAMLWAQQAQAVIARYQAQVEAIQAAYQREVARRQAIVDIIESTADGGGSDGLSAADAGEFEDRPSTIWTDSKRRRVFVVDMWHLDAKHGWYRCVFTGAGKLFTQPAEYREKDQWGRVRKTHPIQAFSLHVSKDLWRYGEIRGMRSTQDEVNFRLSKKLHYLAVNQLWHEEGVFENEAEARAEVQKPDGKIKVRPGALRDGAVRVEKNLDQAMAQDASMQEAVRFLDAEGANLELQGKASGTVSGRAILARQQAGLGQLGPLFDRFHDWELRCYRAMWARVQQFWTAPMYVRVTDDRNAARFAAVNGAQVVHSDNGSAPRDPRLQLGANGGPPMTPADMGETGPMLAELDMDIIIDRAPEAATLQAEQFEALVQLAQSGVLGPPSPDTARLLITASALPNKSELLDIIEKMAAKPQGPNPQEMAMLKRLAAEIERTLAQAQQARATATKTMAEVPQAHAAAVKTGAEARTASATARMTEHDALRAMALDTAMQAEPFGADAFGLDEAAPRAAADPLSGATGLPPSPANGPPPF